MEPTAADLAHQLADLTARVSSLETAVQVLALVVALLSALLLSVAVLGALWLRSQNHGVMEGIRGILEELRMMQTARGAGRRSHGTVH